MNCITGNLALITQIRRLLEGLSHSAYTKPIQVLQGATIGQHFRHILDFYQCLLRDIPEGALDYARRARNPLMETEPNEAGAAFGQIADALARLDEQQPLKVMGDFASSAAEQDMPVLPSSVGRELMYAHDHAVHHLALIRIGMQEIVPGTRIDPHLGYAPATLKYRGAG